MSTFKKKQTDLEHMEQCKKLGIDVNKKRYQRYLKAGLLKVLDEEYVNEIQEYWSSTYGKNIDPILHLAIYNLTGKKNVRIVPGTEMWYDFIPYFNDRCMVSGYKDKNIYDVLIKTENAPKVILKRLRGHFFSGENNQLSHEEAERLLTEYIKEKLIIKPSNTNNGVGIELLQIRNKKLFLNDEKVNLDDLCILYGHNFIVQEVIIQHEIMEKPHPSSVNTLRMVTQRWNNSIEYLLTFARFGADNSVKDNAGTGGLCIGVKENGEFLNYAVDENCNVYTHHPTTNYSFASMPPIPNFDEFINFVKKLHKDILHMDFVSWDIAVGKNGEPVFVEANFAGATWLYQLASGQPVFGELTDEIVKHVSLNKSVKNRDVGLNTRKLRRDNRKLKRNNKKLKRKYNKINKELSNYKIENQELRTQNNNMLSSTSWKITKPLRSIRSKFQKTKREEND